MNNIKCFFLFQEISSSNKSSMRKRLLGVGDKETVLLENKSRNVLKKWDLMSLLGWKAEENNISLLLLFSECSLHFQCESYEDRELLQNTIKKCVFKRNCEVRNWNLSCFCGNLAKMMWFKLVVKKTNLKLLLRTKIGFLDRALSYTRSIEKKFHSHTINCQYSKECVIHEILYWSFTFSSTLTCYVCRIFCHS